MKKLVLAVLTILIFTSSSFGGFDFEITGEYKRGEAEITITEKTYEEVWESLIQALGRLKFRIIETETDGEMGRILAWKMTTGSFYLSKGEYSDKVEKTYIEGEWKIMIESVEDKIIIVCAYEGEGEGIFGSGKKSFKRFSQKLSSILGR